MITPADHQPCLAKDFTPAVNASTLICRICSYSRDWLPLTPVPYPCEEAIRPRQAATRLATAVTRRRTELHLTQTRLAAMADVSAKTITSMEDGAPVKWQTSTKTKVERALRWGRGSIDAILAGGVPELSSTPASTPALAPQPEVQLILRSGLPAAVEETLVAHMQSRCQDMQAALEAEAALLVDQIRAAQSAGRDDTPG